MMIMVVIIPFKPMSWVQCYSGWVPMIARTTLQPKEWIIAKFLFARLVCVH